MPHVLSSLHLKHIILLSRYRNYFNMKHLVYRYFSKSISAIVSASILGDTPCLFAKFLSAPYNIRSFITFPFSSELYTALNRAVFPYTSCTSMSALLSNNICEISRLLSCAAKCKAANPLSSCKLTLAPFAISSFTISILLSITASINGVRP